MPRYFLSLRNGHGEILDSEGHDLTNLDAAMEYAKGVVQELMKNCELQTRHWELRVQIESGEVLATLRFAQLDSTLDHLTPQLRRTVEDLSEKRLALIEATTTAGNTMRQTRALVARSKGRPHLATHQWGRSTNSI